MVAIHRIKVHSIYAIASVLCYYCVKLCLFVGFQSGRLAEQGRDLTPASIIYRVGFGQRGFRARRECTPDTEGSMMYDIGLV